MAKLWEVIKAFQEGTAVVAYRDRNKRVKIVNEENGITFYDQHNAPYENQSLSNYDMAMEWEIIENPAAKTNDYLMVVCKIIDDSKNSWSEHEIFQHCSLDKALEKMKHEFRDNQVYLLSAVASNHKGVVTVLAYEGGMVE